MEKIEEVNTTMDKNLDNCESGDSMEFKLEGNSKIVDLVSIGKALKQMSKQELEDLILKKLIDCANDQKKIDTLRAKFDKLNRMKNALLRKAKIMEAKVSELAETMKKNCTEIPFQVQKLLNSSGIQTQNRESQSNETIGIAKSKSNIRKPKHGPGNTESGSSTSTTLKYKKARTSTISIRKPGASVQLGATANLNNYSTKIGPPSSTSGSFGFPSGNIIEMMDPLLLIAPIPDNQLSLPVLPAPLTSLHQPRGRHVIYTPPTLKLDVQEYKMGNLILNWDSIIEAGKKYAETEYYQLFVCQKQLTENVEQNKSEWKLATIRALPLPITCTLTQLGDNNRSFFIVRGVDVYHRSGELSEICCIENLPK